MLRGAHTGNPQHVSIAQKWSGGQPKSGSHGGPTPQGVSPGTQSAVPSETMTQTHTGFEELQGMNVAHVAPVHSGCGGSVVSVVVVTGDPAAAPAALAKLMTMGADHAIPAATPTFFSASRRETSGPLLSSVLITTSLSPPSAARETSVTTDGREALSSVNLVSLLTARKEPRTAAR
jgi:hypothetical protein